MKDPDFNLSSYLREDHELSDEESESFVAVGTVITSCSSKSADVPSQTHSSTHTSTPLQSDNTDTINHPEEPEDDAVAITMDTTKPQTSAPKKRKRNPK